MKATSSTCSKWLVFLTTLCVIGLLARCVPAAAAWIIAPTTRRRTVTHFRSYSSSADSTPITRSLQQIDCSPTVLYSETHRILDSIQVTDDDSRRSLFIHAAKGALLNGFLLASTTATAACVGVPSKALAAYGDSSSIELPSYVDFLIEKNAQVDPSTFLYKGADREVQLLRISSAVARLKTIPGIAQDRKWSQVQGVLTGPLGTLIQSMNQISGTNKDSLNAAAKVKADVLAIGTAATRKSDVDCISASQAAVQDLEDFVKVAF